MTVEVQRTMPSRTSRSASAAARSEKQLQALLESARPVQQPKRNDGPIEWHRAIADALRTGRFEHLRVRLSQSNSIASKRSFSSAEDSKSSLEKSKSRGFWNRKKRRSNEPENGLLTLDGEGRTPLLAALSSRKTPTDVLLTILRMEPSAARLANDRGRLPLHVAVLFRQHMEVIAELVDAYPSALSAVDCQGQSPLAYAVDIAKKDTNLRAAPKYFWMPVSPNEDEQDEDEQALVRWQEEQAERWGIVHWLLLSSASYPQTCLSVGDDRPMLVEALLYAASPAVISLLIGASVVLLTVEGRASAFAGSTLYTCIARHYPLAVLQSLASQCPRDVRNVRDETGMGYVSAQFISGVFEQNDSTAEWKVIDGGMLTALCEAIAEGALLEDDASFMDWWKKLEYLIAFCDGKANVPRQLLLHSALRNPDVPPSVVRLIVTLWPDVVDRPDPRTQALPIHLAAEHHVYIPRNYEFQIVGTEMTVAEVLIDADATGRAIWRRHHRRLPLHIAVGAGKTLSALESFLLPDPNYQTLARRDPYSGLYPFQQAAAYSVLSAQDGFRWSCVARNKYSHAVWKGLTDRQKATAILRVAEAEDLERLNTVFELLRRQPAVILPSQAKEPASVFRDASGMGMVASHFIAYCYDKKRDGEWDLNFIKSRIFHNAMTDAKATGSLLNTPPDFVKWWQKMKFWIRYCKPQYQRSSSSASYFAHILAAIPREGDEQYLLHAALSNADTPPPVVTLLLGLFPSASQLTIPNTSWLPLHIVAQTVPYSPRSFERVDQSSLEITLENYQAAASCHSDAGLPLHMSIRSGRTWQQFKCLVEVDPRALNIRDPLTKLYPFQLMAIRRSYSPEQQQCFQYSARNRYKTSHWLTLSPRRRASEIRQVQREHNLNVLSSIFELLRRDTSVMSQHFVQDEDGSGEQDEHSLVSDDDSTEEDYSSSELMSSDEKIASSIGDSTVLSGPKAPSLMTFFSRAEQSEEEADVFSRDASVLSGVDVMSTISGRGTFNSHVRRGGWRKKKAEEEEMSLNISDLLAPENTNFDPGASSSAPSCEFAEESFAADTAVPSQSTRSTGERDQLIEVESEDDSDTDSSSNASEGELVYFLMRRSPRVMNGSFQFEEKQQPMRQLKLSKKPEEDMGRDVPSRARSMPLSRGPAKSDSLRALLLSSQGARARGRGERDVLTRSQHSSSDVDAISMAESYSSLRPEDMAGGSSAEMLWVSNKIYEANLLGSSNTTNTSNDSDDDILGPSCSSFRKAAPSRKPRTQNRAKDSSSSHYSMSEAASSVASDATTTIGILENETSSHTGQSGTTDGLASCSSFAYDDGHIGNSAEMMWVSSQIYESQLGHGHDESDSDEDSELHLLDNTLISGGDESTQNTGAQGSDRQSKAQSTTSTPSGTAVSSVSELHLNGPSCPLDMMWIGDKSETAKRASGTCRSKDFDTKGIPPALGVPYPEDDDDAASELTEQADAISVKSGATAPTMTEETYFDKTEMRWKKRPVSTEAEASNASNPSTKGSTESKLERAAKAQSSTAVASPVAVPFVAKDGHKAASSDFYFDKKSMRWRQRGTAPTSPRPSNMSSLVSALQPISEHSQLAVSLPRTETWRKPLGKEPKFGMPFVDVLSRDQIHNKNKAYSMAQNGAKPPKRKLDSSTSSKSKPDTHLVCLVCKKNRREVLMVPCRHLSMCRDCSSKQRELSTCPLCEGTVTDRMLIFGRVSV